MKEAEQKKAYQLETAAFKEWLHKLHPNDQLPRGAFFKNKRAGKPIIIMDECHRYLGRPAHPFPHDPSRSQLHRLNTDKPRWERERDYSVWWLLGCP